MSLSLLLLLLGLCHTCLLTEGSEPGYYNNENSAGQKSRLGIGPYKISNEYSPAEQQLIETAMAVFRQRTCIQFVPQNNQEDYISIENGDGCFSSVGK
ncbi:high choriolytic enzyme 1-like protein [Lates japonicus]|uniref:High choriolytic enzyme 1-like protein n=1 Tax=Lates japonicus TaxID=270547 RepID=A0AAD3N788_LATJO|nr:high choriolytic enzyme 1-like protein [Lates japonicus]